ncbi:transposase [Candidatus Endobugula sertula]|uniref:Transposase n=1 Tax=Candidatus Endobugula sertula TaxID=62101 RepID=A0A1D2QNT9_9GAMM|nr:transposase [Candidatus Endobugula sertula]
MARLPRFCPAGLAQHIVQRGNNRSVCFASKEDFAAYAHWLDKYSTKFKVAIHAWVFMTNHVHLLATPSTDDGIQLMMQSLGRRYVQYFNFAYRRSGTLWEGRYKSSLVDTENYLLVCYRYIELNPVRATMVDDPADYSWSSYRCNALGVGSSLCTPHDNYLSLGKAEAERLYNYRELFKSRLDGPLVDDIRNALNKGLALGSGRFCDEVEVLYGQRVKPAKMGRPKKRNEEES